MVLLWGEVGVGARSVLEHQPADEVAVIRLTLDTLQPGEMLLARVSADVPLAKYSAIAHRIAPWPAAPDDRTALEQAAAQGIAYLLWDETLGSPPLPDPTVARVGRAGTYGLYRLSVFHIPYSVDRMLYPENRSVHVRWLTIAKSAMK